MKWHVQPSTIDGTVTLPGDKSIAHRALMLGSIAVGKTVIENLPEGEDVQSTARCLRDLGVPIVLQGTQAAVDSTGRYFASSSPLDAGNSGTTLRLLAGILAGQPFTTSITGDASLRRRPMRRVIEPLELMGASIRSAGGRAPLTISGGSLRPIRYVMPVASAQVKSCILLAGLYAGGSTAVVECFRTRDHTERMFAATGIELVEEDGSIRLEGGQRPRPFDVAAPGDLSTAAFFFAAAVLTGGSLTAMSCGVNPTRTGFLRALEEMGAGVHVAEEREIMGEPVADVTVASDSLSAMTVQPSEVPLLLDEIPLLALLATQARGVSFIRGARELRFKECDRIRAVSDSLTALGANIQEVDDGFVVTGPAPLHGGTVTSYGDHRLAMMLAIAGSVATGKVTIEGAEAASVSFPQFVDVFRECGGVLYVH
ncbi:MAG: 3-phosphoshikimate 1-carboxyvinyltransferase [Chloroflexota bacterium]